MIDCYLFPIILEIQVGEENIIRDSHSLSGHITVINFGSVIQMIAVVNLRLQWMEKPYEKLALLQRIIASFVLHCLY